MSNPRCTESYSTAAASADREVQGVEARRVACGYPSAESNQRIEES